MHPIACPRPYHDSENLHRWRIRNNRAWHSRAPGSLSKIELLGLPADQRKDPAAKQAAMEQADIVVLCLPDEAAREAAAIAAALGDRSPRILDASTAHRVAEGWTYGFPELAPGQAEAIASARRVANPGCYATGAIALLRPLVDKAFCQPNIRSRSMRYPATRAAAKR